MERDKARILKFDKLITQIINLSDKILLSALQEYRGYRVKDIIESHDEDSANMLVDKHLNKLIRETGSYKKYFRTSMKLVHENDINDMENNHLALFKNMYYKYSEEILYDDEELNDDWIQDHNLLIWYGDTKNKKVTDREGNGCVLRLTDIYLYSIQLQDKFKDDDEAEENDYADLLLLNMYKIFLLFASKKEAIILNTYIHNIEDDLGIGNQKSGSFFESILNNLSSESMENMSELVKNTYIKLKEKSIVPDNISDEQLENMVSSFNKDKLKEVFSSMGNIMQFDENGAPIFDIENIPDKITDFFKSMQPIDNHKNELDNKEYYSDKDESDNKEYYSDDYED